ncbi:unnamed protein product [Arctia plantaginis]|uniref:Uncharacterized protein n=1 Tax=Arctia plantaginis TaxID=874455 RepID=A0A8S0ZXM4_ARCPL|nr:unnamed protein product [Arctia plantaginis]CAB3238370.1 unnamed protein product [Arctia plantaginis]
MCTSLRNIPPSQCYNCRANDTTSCEDSSSWTLVTCTTKRPLCATTASAPDFHSSLICAPVVNTPCTVRTPSNSSFVVMWVCNTHLCNVPFPPQWRNVLINFPSNNTDMKQLNICNSLFKYANNTNQDKTPKEKITEESKAPQATARTSLEPTLVSVPTKMNVQLMLRDSERPRAEALKQQPTVPSDDDEDESEGSGSYEESKIHNNAVSAPAAPSSFLPANENSATSLCKDFLVATLFIYLVV